DDGGALSLRLVDPVPERRRIDALLHDPPPDADGSDQRAEIQEQDMAVAFLEAAEMVAVLLAVADQDARRTADLSKLFLAVAVGDVGFVRLRPLEDRDEEDVEPVRRGHLPQVAVRLAP